MLRLFSKSTNNPKALQLSEKRIGELRELKDRLSIKIKDYSLFNRALTHSSCVDKSGANIEPYERLEFLGDSILNACVAYQLYHNNPHLAEGGLSALRSSLVDEKTLSEIAFNLRLLDYINLGKGETLSDPRARQKVAADITEAVIGVIFLERGFDSALAFVRQILDPEMVKRIKTGTRDFKTQLQKWSVSRFREYPVYKIIKETGPDHNKIFEISVTIHNDWKASAKGRTKKEAEQKAAENVIESIKSQNKL
jgi:ribonuclease III